MSTRLGRPLRLAVALVAAVAAFTLAVTPLDAAIYRNNPFQTAGAVVSDGPADSFVLEGLYRSSGNVAPAADEDGRITVYVHTATRYFAGTAEGDYARSTREEVVVPGADVFVSGRAHESETGTVFVANYVWNPPPDATGPGIPNPTPDLPRDLARQRSYYVRAAVTEGGAPVIGSIGWGSEVGFTIGAFESYGTDHVEQIARSHGDRLRIYYSPYTKFWGPEGRTDDKSEVVRFGESVLVTGKYSWDGTDWRFFASNVFNPPPAASSGGGPLDTIAATPQTDEGEFDPSTDEWVGTAYAGRSTFDFVGTSAAVISLTLDWYWHPDAYWELRGTYEAQQEGQPNRLVGTVDGVVLPGANPQLNAVLTVDEAYGAWAGWTGTGSIRGTAQFVGASAGGTPPSNLYAEWRWTIGPSSSGTTSTTSADEPSTTEDPTTSDGSTTEEPTTSDGSTTEEPPTGSSTDTAEEPAS